MIKDNTVIVIDLGNYKADYGEAVPFKAVITDNFGHEVWIKSLETGAEYEVYEDQILEGLSIGEISTMSNLDKYGDFR